MRNGPLKIAIIAHLKYAIAEPFAGGMEMHTHLLARKLTERGHDVTLFAAGGSRGDTVYEVCPPTAGPESDWHGAQDIDAVEYDAYVAILAQIRQGDFDIIHCNALHYLPLEEAETLRAPMVAVLHTPSFAPLDRGVLSATRHVDFITVSKSLRAHWLETGVVTTVIDNGIDLTRFPFDPAPDAVRFALWSGRIVPEKGLHLAMESARIAALPLKIAGPIIDRAYWNEEIRPRLDGTISYIGHLDHEALALVTGRASVLVCSPRWEEPFGLVVAESLACGTPVAGFVRGALPDILDKSCGALAPADDVAALAQAIRQCLLLHRRDCRQRAEDLFDADLMMDRYEGLYFDLVAARAQRLTIADVDSRVAVSLTATVDAP